MIFIHRLSWAITQYIGNIKTTRSQVLDKSFIRIRDLRYNRDTLTPTVLVQIGDVWYSGDCTAKYTCVVCTECRRHVGKIITETSLCGDGFVCKKTTPGSALCLDSEYLLSSLFVIVFNARCYMSLI